MTKQEQIRIEFEVADRKYEAIGFISEEGILYGADKVYQCVPDIIGDEDEKFLREYPHPFPARLRNV